jgi:peptidoglycan/xylan/chitin deacetylase (PgdA/CDA1 family)
VSPPGRPPALVVSVDFELRWGVRDHCPSGSPYERNLLGAREVVPRTLELFEEFDVGATWATVGFLFARSRSEFDAFRPQLLPTYNNTALNPYLQPLGPDEEADPLHYAGSLVELIRSTRRQELATHTYSHYFCNEPGQTAEQFDADLRAAQAIAAVSGARLRSIVFPRNQHNPEYDRILIANGITAFRGNPDNWMWRFGDARDSGAMFKRLGRLADAYQGLGGDGSIDWSEVLKPGGLADVRASFLVRPYTPRTPHLEWLRLRRLSSAIESTARRGRIVHLWWHPHNFGAHPRENLGFLRELLQEFARCRGLYGMQSLTMSEVADLVLAPAATRGVDPA